MATVVVMQGNKQWAKEALQEAKVTITREGWTDSSTTEWAFIVNTRKTPSQLQDIVWNAGIGWCNAFKKNLKDVGR